MLCLRFLEGRCVSLEAREWRQLKFFCAMRRFETQSQQASYASKDATPVPASTVSDREDSVGDVINVDVEARMSEAWQRALACILGTRAGSEQLELVECICVKEDGILDFLQLDPLLSISAQLEANIRALCHKAVYSNRRDPRGNETNGGHVEDFVRAVFSSLRNATCTSTEMLEEQLCDSLRLAAYIPPSASFRLVEAENLTLCMILEKAFLPVLEGWVEVRSEERLALLLREPASPREEELKALVLQWARQVSTARALSTSGYGGGATPGYSPYPNPDGGETPGGMVNFG